METLIGTKIGFKDKFWCVLGLIGLVLSAWIVGWWPIYSIIWLFAGWKYVLAVAKIKLGIIFFLLLLMALLQAAKEIFYHLRRKYLSAQIQIYLVLPKE